MNVVLCPDTRKLSPQDARNLWWELQTSKAPTNNKGRLQGYGPTCVVLSGHTFGRATVDHTTLLRGESQTFRTESDALRAVNDISRTIPRSTPVLHGSAAMAERQRVWRVDGK